MSSKDIARRAAVECAFQGVDITGSMREFLLSLTYTDNEEDEADDLQIKLQDREDLWLTSWLNDAIEAAASRDVATASVGVSDTGTTSYKVTPAIGLNVRSGPGTSYAKYGALVCGTVVEVSAIENGWAVFDYNGKTAYLYAEYLEPVGEAADSSQETASVSGTTPGFKVQATILRQNWNGDGKDDVLDCGQFELDSVVAEGPPDVITIKATSLPFTAPVRQTEKTQAWEAYYLSGIAQEIAGRNGLACMFLPPTDPYYDRKEQFKVSDIAFLSRLCHEAGFSLKATNNIIVIFDQAEYEANAEIVTITRGDHSYIRRKLQAGTADVEYASCRVSYTDPETGKCIEATARVEDYKEDAKNNQQLEITAKVSSIAEAQTLAEKLLRLHNKYAKTATFTLPGNPAIVAGLTVKLEGWGAWSGKYIVKQAKHSVSRSGYTTQIRLRRVLEGY